MLPMRLRSSIVGLRVALLVTMLLAVPASGAGLPPAGIRPHTFSTAGCSLDVRAAFSHCEMRLCSEHLKKHPLAAAAPAGGYGPRRPAERRTSCRPAGAGQTVAIVDAFDD